MAFQRLFSEAALQQIGRPPSQVFEEALARGDMEEAREMLKEMAAGPKPLHVLGLQTLARMWGFLRNERGEEETDAILLRIADRLVDSYATTFAEGQEAEAIEAIVEIYRNQTGAVLEAGETDDAVDIFLTPCGSGGMLARQKWAEREPEFYAPFGDGTPVMCRGCKALQAAFNRRCGPVWTTEKAPDDSGACSMRFAKRRTQGQELFADPSILTETRMAKATAQLQSGDDTVARTVADHHHEWRSWHDFMLCWLEYTFAAIHELGGFSWLEEAYLRCYEPVFFPRYEVFESWSDEERLKRTAWGWHYHQARFHIIEEEFRFVFILDPCGSGARLFRGDVSNPPFRYERELAPLTGEKAALSFNRSDFPLYCSHCAATNMSQFDGLPLIFLIDGHAQLRPGMPCRQFLYKKGAPRVVERELLAQVGRSELAALQLTNPAKDRNDAGKGGPTHGPA